MLEVNVKAIEAEEIKQIIARISHIMPHWLRVVCIPEGVVIRLTGKDKYHEHSILKALIKNEHRLKTNK